MFEYLPWSVEVLSDCWKQYQKSGKLNIIDIELGGACNFRCKYCDTPTYQKDIAYRLEDIETLILQGEIKWLFLCGLGEPTVGANMKDLKTILSFCKVYNVKCSMFSNIANFDDELFAYVEQEVLYPLFKLDSFDVNLIKKIYNISDRLAKNQLANVYRMAKVVKTNGHYTNIAASIVPSTDNFEELKEIVSWCYENSIYPLIGDLEDAGKGQDEYRAMKLTNKDLLQLRQFILEQTGEDYRIPICPSVLFGLHISYDGFVVVDEISGLSCHWFWLEEPQINKLCEIKGHTFDEMSNIVVENRKKLKDRIRDLMCNRERLVFGGCGGDVIDLLEFYLKKM